MERSLVVFANPQHHVGSTAKSFPNLGILSLASYIEQNTPLQAAYLDGVICSNAFISDFMRQHHRQVLAFCPSLITGNMHSGLSLCADVKALDPSITTIVGNDAFTAIPKDTLRHHPEVDFGFTGNEVYASLARFLQDRKNAAPANLTAYPSLVWRESGNIVANAGVAEPVFTEVDYRLLNRNFAHTIQYDESFAQAFAGYSRRLAGHEPLSRGITVEIARGCVKFSGDQACSFCSIQPGGMARNQVQTTQQAWRAIGRAVDAGFDTLFLTADELPLTFPSLMRDMAATVPAWWTAIPEQRCPVLAGYARADGMQKETVVANMRAVGFRILFVGIDASTPTSLMAMNKVLQRNASLADAEKLFAANFQTIDNARRHDMILHCGLVLGHIGMNRDLLAQNVAHAGHFLDAGRDVIAGVDVELLSPEFGSRDYRYLTQPATADNAARKLSLEIASFDKRATIAARYSNGLPGGFNRRRARRDYVTALMPELTFNDLKTARNTLVRKARSLGIAA